MLHLLGASLASIIILALWVYYRLTRKQIEPVNYPMDTIIRPWDCKDTMFQDNKRAYDDPEHPSYAIKNYKTRLHWIWGVYQKPKKFKPIKLL